MPCPSKFISSSDYASTPAPLSGAKVLTLTTPASQYVQMKQVVEYTTEITLEYDFDALEYIITCDEEPSLIGYSERLSIDSVGTYLEAGVCPVGRNRVQLYATYYSNLQSDTFTGQYTFRAIVIPMKSPYSQS